MTLTLIVDRQSLIDSMAEAMLDSELQVFILPSGKCKALWKGTKGTNLIRYRNYEAAGEVYDMDYEEAQEYATQIVDMYGAWPYAISTRITKETT